jgi:hypothetical protein
MRSADSGAMSSVPSALVVEGRARLPARRGLREPYKEDLHEK